MAEETGQPQDLDFEQAQLAYTIIDNLVEHTRIVSDLIALMAQVPDLLAGAPAIERAEILFSKLPG